MTENDQKRHGIVFAYPYQGHVIPAVHLAIKLASNGFTITFINTQSIHHQLSKAQPDDGDDDLFAGSRQSGLDIRNRTVSDGLPLEFDRNANTDEFLECMLHEFLECADELVGELIRTSTPPVTFLIADTLYAGLLEVANKYGLVSVSLWTQPALVLTLYYHLDLLKSHGHYASATDNRKDIIDYIPGVQAIKPTDLISFLQETDTSTTTHQLICKAFDDVKRVDFIICNTVQDLEIESEAISALHQNQPFFAIGPLLPSGFTKSTVATSLWSKSDCTQWLNTKPHGSVLYVSFGSLAQVSKNDIIEIAHGLSLSGVDFIWVLRQGIVSSGETQILPVGFEEEIKDRGLIVTWCSQIEVISHPSIGGFLTHCGWNSVLESVWCTIPLLCFPVFVDQITNRKLVVDDWRIGMNLCDETPIRREEVRENINRLMSGKRGDELRVEIKNMKRTLENALAANGSSEENFNQFIKEVKFKTHQKHELALSKETIL